MRNMLYKRLAFIDNITLMILLCASVNQVLIFCKKIPRIQQEDLTFIVWYMPIRLAIEEYNPITDWHICHDYKCKGELKNGCSFQGGPATSLRRGQSSKLYNPLIDYLEAAEFSSFAICISGFRWRSHNKKVTGVI